MKPVENRNGPGAGRELTVLHIAPTPFFADRGCHIRIRNEVEALAGHPVRVVICTYHLGRDPQGLDVRRALRVPGYRKLDAGFSLFRLPADLFLLLLVIRTMIREKPDLLHAHLHEGVLIGWLVRLLLLRKGLPLLMDMQGSLGGELVSYGTMKKKGLISRLIGWIESMVYRLPDHIVCSSLQARNTLLQGFGLVPERSSLLQDVVPDPFFAHHDTRAARARLGLPLDRKIVLYSGSLLPGKGVDKLLAAMAILLRQRDDLFFALVGYPVDGAAAFIREHGLEDRVCLAGRVAYDELAQWLATSDVAVDPKEDDSGEASGKLIHYLAAGLPVACFSTANNQKFLGRAGFYGDQRTGQGLAAAIERALRDPDRAREMTARARSAVQRDYSMAGVGAQLARLYQEFVSAT